MKHYLMFDLGTGNTRAAIVRSDGRILGIRTITNTYLRDPLYEDAQYFLPPDWERKMLDIADELVSEHPDIRIDAVSSSAARQTVILLDREGKAFYALPNIDNRGREYMDRISEKAEVYRVSGKWATEDFCAAKLMGLKEKRPEIYNEIAGVTSESEWLCGLFTGVNVCEPTQACEMQLYDIARGSWSEFLCDTYGVDINLLPPLASAGTKLPVLPEFVKRFHMTDDAVFVVGGADTQVAALAAGAGEGDVVIISGTTTPVIAITGARVSDPEERVWVDAGLRGKGCIAEMNPGVTGLNYQRMKDGFLPDISYDELEDAYDRKTCFHCTASFSSLLFYEKRSLRNGGFFMNSPMRTAPDRIDMGWALLADIACSVWEQLKCLLEITGSDPERILGCGGGLRSRNLCGMIAELSGREIVCREGYEQATLLGLVKICSSALGEPDLLPTAMAKVSRPGEKPLVKEYYPVWKTNRMRMNAR